MKPYYQDNLVTLYNADCKIVIEELGRFECLVTDPPYGINEAAGKNKSRGRLATATDYGNSNWDCKPIDQKLLDALISKSNKAAIFGGNYYNLPASSCWLIWDKDNGNTDFADCEMVWTNLKKAVRLKKYRWQGMLQQYAGERKEVRFHPTQKPLAVMKWVLDQVKAGESVLDPFAGSGTTLIAARDYGISSVGIEREEKYCEVIANRLEQGVLF